MYVCCTDWPAVLTVVMNYSILERLQAASQRLMKTSAETENFKTINWQKYKTFHYSVNMHFTVKTNLLNLVLRDHGVNMYVVYI